MSEGENVHLDQVRLSRRRLFGVGAGVAGAAWLTRDVLVGSVPPASAGPLAAGLVREVLPNGLTLIIDERPSAPTLALQLTARAGSRDDAEMPGINLLTSRLIFQGTSRRPSESELRRAAAVVGGSLSRGTTVEQSWYAAVVPSSEAATAFDLLGDLATDPLLAEGSLEGQRQTALQEIGQRSGRPSAVVEDLFQEAMFAGHPARTPVGGTASSVGALSIDQLRATRDRFWGASNLVLVAVGRITAAEGAELARRYFGSLAPGQMNQRLPGRVSRTPDTARVQGEAGEQQVEFRVGLQAPGLLESDRYPLVVLNAIMTGSSGRLFRKLRSERGLAYVVGSGYVGYTDAGAWFVTAGVDPTNVEAALAVVEEEIDRIRNEMVDADEVAARISQVAGRQILADETNAARATRLSAQAVLGTPATEEYVRRIREVTAADVLRVARTYLDRSGAVTVLVTPRGA